MHILVLNGSPKGENSVTLQTVRYLEKKFSAHSFEVLHVGQRIKSIEKDFSKAEEALNNAELLLFSYPVYTFLVPSQLHRFIELVKEHGVDVSGRYAAQITTSLHFYDITAHRFIRDNCDDLGLLYLGGLSADMEDLLKPEGRRQAEDFFRHLMWRAERGIAERPLYPVQKEQKPFVPAPVNGSVQPSKERSGRRIAIVADLQSDALRDMVERFTAVTAADTVLVNLREFPFAGGCLGCFHCAADGTCVYRDGFDTFLRERIQSADAIVYAFSIRDHSMGSRMKLFDDRQFCNGHRTVTRGKPMAALVSGNYPAEENLRTVLEARAETGGNFWCGAASDETDPDTEIDRVAMRLAYAIRYRHTRPSNFYGVGGMKIFRDLIWEMQGLMREDHRFYKQHGFYDFPQKRAGRILGMYAVGAMMHSKKLSKKLGGNMTKGMLMPYQAVIDRADPKKKP